MCSTKRFFVQCLSLAIWGLWLCTSNAMTARPETGYVFQGEGAIKVKLVLLTAGKKPPYTSIETVSWEIEVKPGARFQSVADFLPLTRTQYESLSNEYAKKGVLLPRLEFLLSGRVLRGIDGVVVAKVKRRLDWPRAFQLKSGDIIQIYEPADP